MTMPTGTSGALPTPPPAPKDNQPIAGLPGYNTGSGSSAGSHGGNAQPFHDTPRPSHDAPQSKAGWLPPFRIGTGLPGVDTNDARDLINGRGNKASAKLNKDFLNNLATSEKQGTRANSSGGPHDGGADANHAGRTNSRNNNQRGQGGGGGGGRDNARGNGRPTPAAASHPPINPSSPTVGGSGELPQRLINHSGNTPEVLRRAEAQIGHPDPSKALNPSHTLQSWKNECEVFVRSMLGVGAGVGATAADTWHNIGARDRHTDHGTPPAGVPVFWSGGKSGDGHVAISDGAGNVISTDIGGPGTVSRVPIGQISSTWKSLKYEGWSETLGGKRLFDHPDHVSTGGNDHQEVGATSPNIAGGTSSNSRGGAKSIHSSTASPVGRDPEYAPSASNMPTSSTLPHAVSSNHDSHPFGVAPTGPSGSYTKDEIKQLWVAAGGPKEYADYAAAVAHAESSGNPREKSKNDNGTVDWGLFQRNDKANQGSIKDWDVETNVKWAVGQFMKDNGTPGRGFNDWTDPAVEAYEVQNHVWHGWNPNPPSAPQGASGSVLKKLGTFARYVAGKPWQEY